MADCSGTWTSKIFWRRKNGHIQDPPLEDPDGEFIIDPHTGSTFTGRHHEEPHTTPLFNTLCVDQRGRDRFLIKMHRLDLTVTPPEQFMYSGTGTIDPNTGEMVVTDGEVFVPGGPEPNDAGTWEASKPGGGDDDEDEKKDKKNKERPNKDAVGE